MEGRLIRGWEFIIPGCNDTTMLSRAAILTARRLHEPQPISNQPTGVRVPHVRGHIDPGDNRFRLRIVKVVP